MRLILALLLAAAPATASERPRAEQLVAPDKNEGGPLGGYEANIGLVLKEAFAPDVTFRAIVYPSFDSEYAVGIRRRNAAYELFALRPS